MALGTNYFGTFLVTLNMSVRECRAATPATGAADRYCGSAMGQQCLYHLLVAIHAVIWSNRGSLRAQARLADGCGAVYRRLCSLCRGCHIESVAHWPSGAGVASALLISCAMPILPRAFLDLKEGNAMP